VLLRSETSAAKFPGVYGLPVKTKSWCYIYQQAQLIDLIQKAGEHNFKHNQFWPKC
jgi:hypothetical protein